ncbi:MAG: azurin [Steroidobacteraceae bacterium]
MRLLRLIGAGTLLLASAFAWADPCKVTIEGNDLMQYNLHELAVPAQCAEVEVTLRHSGQLSAKVMGHDWVLTRDEHMSAIVNAGLAAGLKHGYLPQNDARIIAATRLVGGGESDTIKFSTATLLQGARYAFFCSSPGHATLMRGRFIFGDSKRLARAK